MVPGAPTLTAQRTLRRRRVAVSVRVAAVVTLLASAVLGIQAAWSRWSVCFVGGEPPVAGLPEDGAGGCVALQNHLYDYTFPTEPWVPIADAAQREGLSLMALGVAVLLVSLSVVDRWSVSLPTVAGGAAIGATWLAAGVPTLQSGLAGKPVDVGPPGAVAALILLVPLVPVGLAVLSWRRAAAGFDPDGRLLAVFWLAMVATHPLAEFFITLTLWASHDSSPLSGFFRCAVVAVGACTVAATLVPAHRRPRLPRRSGAGA
ncbi:hypothetical protein ATJ97_2221 [Georgenia soli]|uniref:Uncharacterized protein n=1 Tax=Georgenia soli TaxID=638953 RepID=A0A2A9ELC3_9MICO|nr:hypothetical protein [Georgenia soli]PFG39708.1 hypothetical protein ATJ97_2221 [Georgenia soli]